ncbi:hypothetical protein EQ826_24075 [Ectopseudomonas mendocina]|jgi:hypothetical protein|nr:replication initiation protein [Pseudomonas mendocina]TRO19643.1 hypothetical protein EQ826_24075 [Pseudomonas mendocina]
MQQLALFETPRLPRKPYCTDDLDYGLMVRPLHIAIQKRYIQPNPPGIASYLAFDIDRGDAGAAWLDSNAPRPNFIIKNPENGHAHYLYALEHPVCTTSAARIKPMRYLAAIEAAIARELGADAGYSGLIIKNPCHGHWQTIIVEPNFYSMSALAEHLDLTARPANDERGCQSGLGRNCTIFDTLRQWAYKAVTDYWKPNGELAWSKAVRERAHVYNVFPEPLQPKEVNQIAKSVSKWVWKHFSPAARQDLIERTHTPELQAKRGAKKGEAKRQELMDKAMLLTLAGYSTREIGAQLGVTAMTVSNWIKRSKAKDEN